MLQEPASRLDQRRGGHPAAERDRAPFNGGGRRRPDGRLDLFRANRAAVRHQERGQRGVSLESQAAQQPAGEQVRRPPVRHGPQRTAVPILMYHLVNSPPPGTAYPELWVPAASFRAQIQALSGAGYHGITLDQLLDNWQHRIALPAKPVVVSFDDGYGSQVRNAMPGAGVTSLRAAPVDPQTADDPYTHVGVPVTTFPRWLRCPACYQLLPIDGVDQGDFFLGKKQTSNRESLITFMGDEIVAVRWRNWRIYPKEFNSSAGNPSPRTTTCRNTSRMSRRISRKPCSSSSRASGRRSRSGPRRS